MTIARVAGQTDQIAFTTSGTSIGMTLPQNVVSGNSVMCGTRSDNTAGGTIPDDHGVTDSVGSTYSKDRTEVMVDECRMSLLSAVMAASGANTVTLSAAGQAASRRMICGMEYDITGGRALDKVASAQAASGTAVDSGLTATTIAADELLFGVIGTGSLGVHPYTAGSGWALRAESGETEGRSGFQDQIVSATGTYKSDATLTATGRWVSLIATYSVLADAAAIPGSRFENHRRSRPSVVLGNGLGPGARTQRSPWPEDAKDFGLRDQKADNRSRAL